jgi:hypothetical protein
VVEVAAARAAAVGGGAAREVEGVEKVVAVGAGRSRRRGAAAQPGVPQGCRATSGAWALQDGLHFGRGSSAGRPPAGGLAAG